MRLLVWFIIGSGILHAKEVFLVEHIYEYLNKDNPFYYQAIGEQYVAKGREKFYEGSLDTQLNAKYNNKDYPTTTGQYEEVELLKPLENGIELSMGYRKAKGTQEFNNIITGKNGELISSIKIPLFSVLYDISKNKVAIQSAQISTIQAELKSDLNLLKLYVNISKIYYQMLLQKQLMQTQKELLSRAKTTRNFIEKQIGEGKLPAVMIIEIDQIIMQREREVLYEKNSYVMVKNIFLQYLGIDTNTFRDRFKIPTLKPQNKFLPSLEKAYSIAIPNRPNLKIIDFEIKKLVLNKSYNDVSQYPKLDMKFSGVYDSLNQEGYKVSLTFNLPLERGKFRGMDEVLQKKNLMKQNDKLRIVNELKTSIMNIYEKIKIKKEAIVFTKKELTLARKLELVEMKKIRVGIGNLIFLNQREIGVLKVRQKLLRDYYDLKIYYLELDYFFGKSPRSE